jgi:NADH oxidase (H2O2-forming)
VPRTVLVIGGGPAGVGAARAARAVDRDATVALYAPQPDPGRTAAGLPGVTRHDLPVRAVDLSARTLTAEGADPVRFDALVLTDVPADPSGTLPGAELAGVQPADGRSFAEAEATRAVVVGATPAGLAAVAELVARGVPTHLVEPSDQLLAGTADPDMVAPVAEQLTAAGVTLHLSTTVEALLGEQGRLTAVRTADGQELPAELAVLAADPPDAGTARTAGVALDADGRLRVDDRMRTASPGVFAAGRLTAAPGTTSSHAYAQGRVAGSNAAGADRRYHAGFVPWSAAAGQDVVGGAGYGETAATALGLRYLLARSVGISRARYYPGVQQVAVKLLAEPGSLRLIGGQLRGGGEGVRERAMFLAQAVRLGLTLTDLSTMENVYSPAIGALNEPIVVAATNGLAEHA